MSVIEHNRELRGKPTEDPFAAERVGTICVLLSDGRLVGPFGSAADARYWATSQELRAFSTYDLLSPERAT